MKLIGFLLVLFVGMSGLTYGQTDQDSKHIVSDSTISQIVNYFDQQYKLNNSKGVLVYADEVSVADSDDEVDGDGGIDVVLICGICCESNSDPINHAPEVSVVGFAVLH